MAYSILIIFSLACLFTGSEGAWSYGETNGPSTWANTYPACAGSMQSPIPLFTTNTSIDLTLAKFASTSFTSSTPTASTIKNTGYSLMVSLTGGYTLSTSTAQKLTGNYQLEQFHLHWGDNTTGGSEHTLNDVRYFSELHFVHRNTKYSDMATAAAQPDGLMFFAFFVQDNSFFDNLQIAGLTQFLPNVTFLNEEVAIPVVPNYNHVPSAVVGDYFRYKGSLTTPGCQESVLWYVFQTPVSISAAQANLLRYGNSIYSSADGSTPLLNNYRPLQDPGNRNISRTFSFGSASFQSSSYHLVAICIMFVASVL
ncbi:carbonic anhydrase-like [Ciona intestinalis]